MWLKDKVSGKKLICLKSHYEKGNWYHDFRNE